MIDNCGGTITANWSRGMSDTPPSLTRVVRRIRKTDTDAFTSAVTSKLRTLLAGS